MKNTFSQAELDLLADILWWLRGYIAAKAAEGGCYFDERHMVVLRRLINYHAAERSGDLSIEFTEEDNNAIPF